jgi:hypothetical protein
MWMYRHAVADGFALYRFSGFASREPLRRQIIRTCGGKEGSVRDQALAPAGTTRSGTGRDAAVAAAAPLAGASMHLALVSLMV